MTHRTWTRHDLERLLDGDLSALESEAIERDLARDAVLRTRLNAVRTLDEAIADALQPAAASAQRQDQMEQPSIAPRPSDQRRTLRRTAQPFKAILLAAASVLIVIGAGMYFAPRSEPVEQPNALQSEIPWQTSRTASSRRFGPAPLNTTAPSRARLTSESDERRLPPPAPLRLSTPSLRSSRSAKAITTASTASTEQSTHATPALHSAAEARALFDGLSNPQRIAAAELLMRNPGLRSVAFQELARLRDHDAPDPQITDLLRRIDEDPELRTWAVAYQLSNSDARSHIRPGTPLPRTLPNGA